MRTKPCEILKSYFNEESMDLDFMKDLNDY